MNRCHLFVSRRQVLLCLMLHTVCSRVRLQRGKNLFSMCACFQNPQMMSFRVLIEVRFRDSHKVILNLGLKSCRLSENKNFVLFVTQSGTTPCGRPPCSVSSRQLRPRPRTRLSFCVRNFTTYFINIPFRKPCEAQKLRPSRKKLFRGK